MDKINQLIAEGRGLKPICNEDDTLPSWRTVLRHIREDDEAHRKYREARTIQAECMRDEIIELTEILCLIEINPHLFLGFSNGCVPQILIFWFLGSKYWLKLEF